MSEFVTPLDSDEEEMEKARVKKEKKLKKIMELQQIDQEMMCPSCLKRSEFSGFLRRC